MKENVTSKMLLEIAFELGDKLTSQKDDKTNFQTIVDTIGKRLAWDYGEVWFVEHLNEQIVKSDIIYLNEQHKDLSSLNHYRSHISWRLNEGIPGVAWKTKKAIWISSFDNEYAIHNKEILLKHRIKAGVAVPIFSGEYMIAVLFFMSLSEKPFNESLMDLLELLAGRLGLLIIKIDLEREMVNVKTNLQNSIDLNFATMNKILEYRDPYTVDHQKKVAKIALRIAAFKNYDNSSIQDLILAAQLHDIGKLAIPIEILNKPGPISKEEYNLIKTHVETSYELVASLPCSDSVKRMIHEHHERENGSGYPNGLKSDQLSPLSKILIVADVISAMQEDRPYRKALSKRTVISELQKGKGALYDSDCVEYAIEQLKHNLL